MRTDVLQCWKRKQGQDSPRGNGTMTKEEALKTYYGYDVFRGGQEAVIDALLSGRDALAIMPTGAGKSVCYQIPALLLSGITLVVSPLVSLMRDQVTQLVQMGIPAAFLNSSLTFRQYLLALDRAGTGRPPAASCCTVARMCGLMSFSSPTASPGRTWIPGRPSSCGSGTCSGCGR